MSRTKLAPFPYNVILSGTGLMCVPDPQTGVLMSGAKIQPFENVQPADYSYATTPPFVERPYSFRRFIMGMGERQQQFATIRRYFYADGVDCSINGMPMLGPGFTTVTPTVTGSVAGFYEALSGGTLKLFALCGRYVNVRNADTGVGWLQSKDLGVGVLGASAQRFQDAGATPTDALYVTTGAQKCWRYSGATDTTVWTDISANLSATAGDQKASFLELNNNFLIRSWDNKVSTCTSDPNVAANWSGTVFIGDSSQPITWLRTLEGTVFIFKTDGVYDIDAAGNSHSLFPQLRITYDLTNGRNANVWQNSCWFRYGDGFYQLGPNTSGIIDLRPVGTERFIENDSPVRGYVTAAEGFSNWFNFLSLYNSELNTSYLLKFGSWFVDDQPPMGSSAYVRSSAVFNPLSTGGSFFEPVLHGSIATFAGKKITAMKVSSIPGPNQRLYIGFSDGTISWTVLPRGTPNPLADQNTTYQAQGNLYFSGHSMGFPGNVKDFRGVTMMGPRIDEQDSVAVAYRTTPAKSKTIGDLSVYTIGQLTMTIGSLGSSEYTALGEYTFSGERIDIVSAAGQAGIPGTAIDLRLTLNGGPSSTPFIEGFALHEQLRPDLLLERSFTVNAEERIARRDGTTDWQSPQQIRSALQMAADAKGTVPMTMPDGKSVLVSVVDYNENQQSDQVSAGNAWTIPIKAVEFKSTILFGTIARLKGYTILDLRAFTVKQLGSI